MNEYIRKMEVELLEFAEVKTRVIYVNELSISLDSVTKVSKVIEKALKYAKDDSELWSKMIAYLKASIRFSKNWTKLLETAAALMYFNADMSVVNTVIDRTIEVFLQACLEDPSLKYTGLKPRLKLMGYPVPDTFSI